MKDFGVLYVAQRRVRIFEYSSQDQSRAQMQSVKFATVIEYCAQVIVELIR
jgi:hypothetical protein